MNKDEWIKEAQDQIKYYESTIKYLKACCKEKYEKNTFFKAKDLIKIHKKQIQFLEDGIYLIEQLDSIIPSNY